jgi:hypothetical protein
MDRGVYERVRPYTLCGPAKIHANFQAAMHVAFQGIPGAIVETGCWQGGSAMALSLGLQMGGDPARQLWVYDTFETGMTRPPPGEVNVWGDPAREGPLPEGSPTAEEVYRRLRKVHVGPLEVVQGSVVKLSSMRKPGKIALLRIDTDYHDSVAAALDHLWPLVVPGGVVMIDDYGYWSGARRAAQRLEEEGVLLWRIDREARCGVKPGKS